MGATITDPLVGRLVDGRYEVVSRIARGGMATVYLALDRRLDREVALKVMHPHLAEGVAGSAFLARFRREARASARLTHPALVGVLDQGVDGETSYLTMEYVDGVNLRRHLGERGALSPEEAFTILERVLDGLGAAHRSGLVHRDIKPENVLLATDGRIKLTDFGLARAVTEITSTTTGTVLGTVAYLGPELVSKGVSDARTDVYAVGIMLYEMLTGRQPHTGSTPIQVAFAHVNTDIPVPSDTVDWLPQEIDDLVSALAARDPDDRPVDAVAALELVRRTHAALDPSTLARRADVAPTLTPDGAAAEPAPAGGAAAGTAGPDGRAGADEPAGDGDSGATTRLDVAAAGRTIALAIGTGVRTPQDVASQDRAAAAPARRRRQRLWAGLALVLAAALAAGTWWFLTTGPGAYRAVPDVVGKTQSVAVGALKRAGLAATSVPTFDQALPGTVVSTRPAPNARVRKDGSVRLAVSRGPEMTTVPAGLVGLNFDAAAAALTKARFTVGDSATPYDDVAPVGSVMAVSAPPGTSLRVGSTITMTVSQGRAPVTIISVVGATQEQATTDLTGQGLKVNPVAAFSDTVAAGHVISQDPLPGTDGHRQDKVTIAISQGPELIAVPSVLNQPYDVAAKTLTDLGFTPKRSNFLGGLLNTVRAQSVKAGDKVARGTAIVLTVV